MVQMKIRELNSNQQLTSQKVRSRVEAMQRNTRNPETICSHIVILNMDEIEKYNVYAIFNNP